MREFLILITELLVILILQIIIEAVFDAEKHKKHMKVVNISCLMVSYVLLARYVYNHLWSELLAFVNF